ncbi:thiamine pyrophosphate-dependent enzyme [Pseudoalteromonas denitrificans]|uniref:Thiamine pyrophosphate enzyme, central domain n=1 Tax=Pseudoalteromonas denitrificans DSM 6059 TaxID=1123010 RepID=A0A1I1FAC5_9GAMM|nr:thiamine pyrophosphate-dependent enzyme [Pseudoalteromonas denitrificans]SFB96335.1 Thiamine pyrophosphate enzyme, central domain [Pseudoalteromonas denitrificans DSM 6059]
MTDSFDTNFGQAYNESLPTLGKVMGDVIQFFGHQKMYGVGGDFAANLITALEDHIQIFPSSNEMHAGFSACAQAEVDGMGFCLTTYMVGSLPCTSAAALAVTEGLPVVFISGAPAESEINDVAIHHTIHPNSSWKAQYDNALESFAALGMKVTRLQGQRSQGQPNTAGENFYQIVAHAYQTKQPVFIEVPRDQVFAKTQPLKFPPSPDAICCGSNVLGGSNLIANKIITELNQSQYPLLYVGDRLKHNNKLKNLVIEFSKKYNIPFATSWFAKGLFDEFSPLCLGAYNGVFTQTSGKSYIEQNTDYVLEVATSILAQDSNTAFGTGTHALENFKNKTTLKGGSLLEKDLIEVFELLLTSDIPTFDYIIPNEQHDLIDQNEDIDFNNLAKALNEIQAIDKTPYVYLPEVGNSYFSSYGLKVRGSNIGRGWLTNPWYGAMGTALPYARVIAQKIQDTGNKDRAVVIIGDGGFHFQLNELIHFLKDNTQVTIIYMRNNIYHLGKSSDANIYSCNDNNFDVHSIIKGYAGQSSTCKTVAEFKTSFNECTHNKGVNLIEVLAKPIEQRQCNELRLLNMYIKSKNGNKEAIEQWQEITQ